MTETKPEEVYATLLLTDTYLPGALVLAHSLRDAGTTRKLACLVTTDSVSAEVIDQLRTVYDYVIPVPRIENPHPANLDLMNRRDLRSAFTKINLWKQTQFRRIVYVDADVVAYRAPDELFDLPHPFAAAPDIGWPDLFNTGVMVLTPNLGDYHALLAMAQGGISFDGADQGLLNIYFGDKYHRLSFTYNVTPSAHYQYVPAYTHYQSKINMVHFIGAEKPWMQGREVTTSNSPFYQMVARWWAVYDRHYRVQTANGTKASAPSIVQYFVKGEFQPTVNYVVPVGEQGSWDAQRQAPPANSRGEAVNFPNKHYAMSSDTSPFVSQEHSQHHDRPKPIFPWERQQSRPTRVFGTPARPAPPAAEPTAPSAAAPAALPGPSSAPSSGEPAAFHEPSMSSASSTVGGETLSRPRTPISPVSHVSGKDGWSAFPRTNAWDDVPEISRYIERHMPWYLRHQQQQQARLKGMPDDENELPPVITRRSSRVTDFPTSDERPSLPVTPAPVRRPKSHRGWKGEGEPQEEGWDDEHLPAAEGVPPQSEWVCVHGIRWAPTDCLCDYLANVLRLTYHKDPAERLRKLAREQSEMLFRRLSSVGSVDHDEHESTITAPSVFSVADTATGDTASVSTYVPSIPVVSPRFVKPASPVMQKMLADAPELTLPSPTAYHARTRGFRFEMVDKAEEAPTSRTPVPKGEPREALAA
ncbi:hypothetical protein VTJ83DRAFT_5916 [Remersonia thermophila]|uniref:Uncharacterized protein n=1 Tax=Remersonia thermophila TaxID=72144 RepID=A0ABR4DAD8_9PEZI